MSELIDRGLVRPAVQAYARQQGVTYEDAHQIRRKGTAKPEVTEVAPSKWELSRKDEAYRKQLARACNIHYQRLRSEYGV